MKTAEQWARQLEADTGIIGSEGEVAIVTDIFQQAMDAASAEMRSRSCAALREHYPQAWVCEELVAALPLAKGSE